MACFKVSNEKEYTMAFVALFMSVLIIGTIASICEKHSTKRYKEYSAELEESYNGSD